MRVRLWSSLAPQIQVVIPSRFSTFRKHSVFCLFEPSGRTHIVSFAFCFSNIIHIRLDRLFCLEDCGIANGTKICRSRTYVFSLLYCLSTHCSAAAHIRSCGFDYRKRLKSVGQALCDFFYESPRSLFRAHSACAFLIEMGYITIALVLSTCLACCISCNDVIVRLRNRGYHNSDMSLTFV